MSNITVLSYEITGKMSEHIVLDFTLSTFCQAYHFRDLTKMVIHVDILWLTWFYGSTYSYSKILPTCIVKNRLKFACKPYFNLFRSQYNVLSRWKRIYADLQLLKQPPTPNLLFLCSFVYKKHVLLSIKRQHKYASQK